MWYSVIGEPPVSSGDIQVIEISPLPTDLTNRPTGSLGGSVSKRRDGMSWKARWIMGRGGGTLKRLPF